MSMIEIRSIACREDYDQLEALQMAVWGSAGPQIMSALEIHASAENGMTLLCAYDGEQIVGFVLGMLGYAGAPASRRALCEQLKMYSVMMGVLPAYQSLGIGLQLKKAQRDAALNMGLDLITWTFDPLESRNGWLNIGKLGAICRQYKRNHHGDMEGINAGIPTDRFDIEWRIASQRVVNTLANPAPKPLSFAELQKEGVPLLNPAKSDSIEEPRPSFSLPLLPKPKVLIEIPSNYQQIKRQNMPLALGWRHKTRLLFEAVFAADYVVTGFAAKTEPERRTFYLLEKSI